MLKRVKIIYLMESLILILSLFFFIYIGISYPSTIVSVISYNNELYHIDNIDKLQKVAKGMIDKILFLNMAIDMYMRLLTIFLIIISILAITNLLLLKKIMKNESSRVPSSTSKPEG